MNDAPRSYRFDRFEYHPADGRLTRPASAASVTLRPQVGALLVCLLHRPRAVVDRDTLRRAVWGDDTIVDFDAGMAALMRELRRALDQLGADRALIETIPRRGYRLNTEAEAIPGAHARAVRRSSRLPSAVLALVLTVALAALVWRVAMPPVSPPPDTPQLAILPLERFGEADYPPQRAGIRLADGVLAALWRAELEQLELIGRAGMRPYAGRDDVVSAVASDLGVDLLIEGSIRAESNRWQVDLRLLAVPPGRVIWSHTLEGNDPALPVAEIADRLVDRLKADWPRLRSDL